MADFCQQCSIEHFGEDFKELAGLSTEEGVKENYYAVVLYEGCGPIQVDVEGRCISSDCMLQHGKAPSDVAQA